MPIRMIVNRPNLTFLTKRGAFLLERLNCWFSDGARGVREAMGRDCGGAPYISRVLAVCWGDGAWMWWRRRFTGLTGAFSEELENREHSLALYFMHYSFARPHKKLSNPYPKSLVMAAGLINHIWTVEEIVKLAQ